MTESALNMKLLAQHELDGFGGIGEGMSIQLAKDGRRILYLAHESAPKNFTGVDVTDPRKPKLVVQTELPHKQMRSNSLEICGDIMAVAYQTAKKGMRPAGVELFDIAKPEQPKSIALFDCSGPHSRGVHQVWFVDSEFVHCAGAAADFVPRHPNDDQFYQIIDVRNPSKPVEAGRWWVPGVREGDSAPAPKRNPFLDAGYRPHNTNVYPERPDRAYVACIDGGVYILDIADKAQPRIVGHWNPQPPFPGFTHTAMPLFDRDLLIVSDEAIRDKGGDWPKLVWLLDIRNEANPVSFATLPLPPVEGQRHGGRYGAHNIHENRPGPSFRSDKLVFGTYFNGGVRIHDIANPFAPKEVAHFVPPAPRNSPAGAIQLNDVYVDENEIIYTVDRFTGGLYVIEAKL